VRAVVVLADASTAAKAGFLLGDRLRPSSKGRGSSARAGRAASPSPRRGQGYRAFREAEYSALPQITNGEVIILTLRTTEGRPRLSLRDGQLRPHIEVMHLDLSDEEAAALTQERHHLVESDRYPLSPRIAP
jgi:hypothetical protein